MFNGKSITSFLFSLFTHVILFFILSIIFYSNYIYDIKDGVHVEFDSFRKKKDAIVDSKEIQKNDRDGENKETNCTEKKNNILEEPFKKDEDSNESKKIKYGESKTEDFVNHKNLEAISDKLDNKESKINLDVDNEEINTHAKIEEKKAEENSDKDITKSAEGYTQIDKRSIYYEGEDENNALLELEGWTWDEVPKPNDKSNEIGKIVFEITVNSFGEILSIRTLERTVSLEVVNIYKDALINITFTKTDAIENEKNSSGRVTFYIKYR